MTHHSVQLHDNTTSLSFFELAMSEGSKRGIITREKIEQILRDGPKGIIQIAQTFENPHMRGGVEAAQRRFISLISLYLENESEGDIEIAMNLIAQSRSILELSKGGSFLIKELGRLAVNEFTPLDEATKSTYHLFQKPIPWSKGGNIRKYTSQYAEYTNSREAKEFARELAKIGGLEDTDYEDIIQDIFPIIITGRTLISEALSMIELGEYRRENWELLLFTLSSKYPTLVKKYSFYECMKGLLGDFNERTRNAKNEDIFAGRMEVVDPFIEWNTLFLSNDIATSEAKMTAVITGALTGKMQTTISRKAFYSLCEWARKEGKELYEYNDYIDTHVPPEFGMNALLSNRIEKEWNTLVHYPKPVNGRSHIIRDLMSHFCVNESAQKKAK